MKKIAIRVFDKINSVGFALIIGSVIYYIIGAVAGLVGGHMLDWSFCSSLRSLAHINWCDASGLTGVRFIDHLLTRLSSISLSWFMIFWGFVFVGISSLALRLLGAEYPSFSLSKKDKP